MHWWRKIKSRICMSFEPPSSWQDWNQSCQLIWTSILCKNAKHLALQIIWKRTHWKTKFPKSLRSQSKRSSQSSSLKNRSRVLLSSQVSSSRKLTHHLEFKRQNSDIINERTQWKKSCHEERRVARVQLCMQSGLYLESNPAWTDFHPSNHQNKNKIIH